MDRKLKLKDVEAHVKDLSISCALEYLLSVKDNCSFNTEPLINKYIMKQKAYNKEIERLRNMMKYELLAYEEGCRFVAGTDEVGRGPLAGPVIAAAVILPRDTYIHGLNDSKQLSAKQRDRLFEEIKAKAVCYGIGLADEKCIDDINILNATKQAMQMAFSALRPVPDVLLTDAVALDIPVKQYNIVKGDCLSVSIAAASILAKVTRDRLLDELDCKYPQYGFSKHKGYGTKEHIDAIKRYGICPIHRISFTRNFTA